VVPDDGYESNDTCSDGYELPPAEEDASAVVIQDATLHHQDSGPDTDWYFIVAQPGIHFCYPGEKLCYFAFRVALTPPATADHAVYRMCVSSGVCGSAGETCTTAADWNGTRYDLVLQSQMSCGLIQNQPFHVKIDRIGGTASCETYELQYQYSFTDQACP
jgi:hypothetical protein